LVKELRLKHFFFLNVALLLIAGYVVTFNCWFILAAYWFQLLMSVIQIIFILLIAIEKRFKEALKSFAVVVLFSVIIIAIYYVQIILLAGSLGDM